MGVGGTPIGALLWAKIIKKMTDIENTMRIGATTVGFGQPVFVIAEACENHFGSLDIAKRMVEAAKKCGCNAIKFQHHLPDEEMLPDVPQSENFSERLYDFLKRCSLNIGQHNELKKYCERIGIEYLCTPFSYKAAQELFEIGVRVFKIGSGEMTDLPTLRSIAGELKVPMLISTGMSTFDEIDETYQMLIKFNLPLGLLNCVSEYPPEYSDLNLRVISEMQKRYPRAIIGHSDHTADIYTALAAVTLGAKVIEKHVTLDKSWEGPDQSVSLDFDQIETLVDGIRKIELALGSVKQVHRKEEIIRSWAFRSLVLNRDMAPGEILTAGDISSKRPGTGIPSKDIDKFIGRKLRKHVAANTFLQASDVEKL